MRTTVVVATTVTVVLAALIMFAGLQVDILLNGKLVPELCYVCHRSKAAASGRKVCLKLKENINRQQFEVIIQAAIGVKVSVFRRLFSSLPRRQHIVGWLRGMAVCQGACTVQSHRVSGFTWYVAGAGARWQVFAKERIAPYRKDVLTKGGKTVGGGDVTRKKKLLEKQKAGKKRMKTVGTVELSQEAFHSVLTRED